MHDFTSPQVIVHKAGLKLVSVVRTYELVNGIMNADLLERHSDYRHDKPPKRPLEKEILVRPNCQFKEGFLAKFLTRRLHPHSPFVDGWIALFAVPNAEMANAVLKIICDGSIPKRVDHIVQLDLGSRYADDYHRTPQRGLVEVEILA